MPRVTTSPILSPSTGALDALRGLLGPLHFTPREPTERGVRYSRRSRGLAPLADVYLPDRPGPRPSVVLVHGGGFVVGSRSMKPMRLLATRFAEAGYAAVTFDYRMIFRGGRLDESVGDVEDMVGFWHASSTRYGLDDDRVALMGLSAGAALAVLAASVLKRELVERLVCVFGVYDFAALEGRRAALLRRLLLETDERAEWRRRSPLEASDRVPQPMLLVHGTGDRLVPVEHTRTLHERRLERGLPVAARYVEGAPHGFFNDPRHAAAAAEALEATLHFLAC